jgi:hypothetical protein
VVIFDNENHHESTGKNIRFLHGIPAECLCQCSLIYPPQSCGEGAKNRFPAEAFEDYRASALRHIYLFYFFTGSKDCFVPM